MDEDEEFQLLLQQMNKVPKSDKLKSLKKSFIINATKPIPPIQLVVRFKLWLNL